MRFLCICTAVMKMAFRKGSHVVMRDVYHFFVSPSFSGFQSLVLGLHGALCKPFLVPFQQLAC